MRAYTEVTRKYYKYGLTPNVDIVGNPTITNGIGSNFSTSNYLTLPNPFNPQNKAWEFITKVNLGSGQPTDMRLFVTDDSANTRGFLLGSNNGTNFYIWISSNGSSWDIATQVTGTFNFSTAGDFYIRCGWNTTKYYVDYSLDGVNYTNDITVNSTTKMYVGSGLFTIGKDQAHTVKSSTTVDLTKSKIILNGKDWWHGTKAEECPEGEAEFYKDIYNHKCYRKTTRKYYKNVDIPWIRPNITSNGTMGGDSFACNSDAVLSTRYAWYAFNGILGTDYDTFLLNTKSGNLYFYNPVPIKISKLTVTNRNEGNVRPIKSGTFYGSNDNSSWVELCTYTNTNYSNNGIWDIAVNSNEYYKYYKLYMSNPNDSYVGLNELDIIATTQKTEECPEEEAEFYKDISIYGCYRKIVRKYYKYSYMPWTQPIALSNTTTLPEGNMIISASNENTPAWQGFNQDHTSSSWDNVASSGWWQVKFPYKIFITGLTFYNRSSHNSSLTKNACFYTDSTKVKPIGEEFIAPNINYGSIDIIGIPQEGIETDTIYLDILTCWAGTGNNTGMSDLVITALVKTIEEATEDDYDFYKDVDIDIGEAV